MRPKWEIAGWVGVAFGVIIQFCAFLGLVDEDLKVVAGIVGQVTIILSLVVTTVILPRRRAIQLAWERIGGIIP